MTKRTF